MTLGSVAEPTGLGLPLPLSLSARLFLIPVGLSLGIPPANRPPNPIGLPLLILFVLGDGDLVVVFDCVLDGSPQTFPETPDVKALLASCQKQMREKTIETLTTDGRTTFINSHCFLQSSAISDGL